MSAVMNVVRAEWFKVWRKRRLYILAGLYWVVLPVLILVVARIVFGSVGDSFVNEAGAVDATMQQLVSPYGLARLLLVGPGYMSPTFYIVCVTLIAALLIGDERNQNMWKTVLVVQPNRVAVITGKVIVAMLALGVLLFGALVAGLLFGAAGTLFLPTAVAGGAWSELVGLYFLQWAFLLAPVLLAFLLIFVVRSGVLGVVAVLFLPSLLEAIYSVLSTIAQLQPLNRINAVFQALRLKNAWESLPQYFFTANLYAPARAPTQGLASAFGEELGAEFGSELGPVSTLLGSGITLPHAALVMAAYAALFAVLLYLAFTRRDVD
ncbi:MAG: ABC transporter permease [Trueperaceae bacterium]